MRSVPFRFSISGLIDHKADVVFARPDRASAAERSRATDVLDDNERARAAKFVFDRDRELFIFSRGFLRLSLGRYLAADARDLRFVTGPTGRPELASPACKTIRFNLSHTEGLVGAIFTRAQDCGVDVENRVRAGDYKELISTVLAPAEAAELMLLNEEGRPDRFLEIWTLKEAYLKGRGLGLSYPPRSVSFSGFDCDGPERAGQDPYCNSRAIRLSRLMRWAPKRACRMRMRK
jgi:4'-phosphopantetheinyl transferase